MEIDLTQDSFSLDDLLIIEQIEKRFLQQNPGNWQKSDITVVFRIGASKNSINQILNKVWYIYIKIYKFITKDTSI